MYDPKFEKGVRQKMEGLEFAPPESVWANIEKAVAGRRRRTAFYFWRFALPGVLLVGAVSVLYLTVTPTRVAPTASKAAAPAGSASAGSATPAAPATAAPATAATPASPVSAAPARQHPVASTGESFATKQSPGVNDAGRTGHDNAHPHRLAATTQRLSGNGNPTTAASTQDDIRTATDVTAEPAGTKQAIAPYLFQPGLAGQGDKAAIKAAKLSAKTTLIALNSLQKKKRPWEAGFTAGGGISRLNRLNVNTGNSALSTSLYNISSAPYAAPSKKYISDIRPYASFEAGIYLQKPLSDRWSVNLGMNLHYYSTRITIGEAVNTYVPVSASLIAPTVTPPAQSTTSFIAGDREVVTNHYYFLELPVNMQFTLKKSRLLPVFLQGGLSLSRLVGADALFYNAHSGVYYKDPAVMQKTQVNVSSALMVGLPLHGIRIELGPQVQYGLTPLINNHNQGDQHFLYTGIRVVVIPVKK